MSIQVFVDVPRMEFVIDAATMIRLMRREMETTLKAFRKQCKHGE